MLNGSADFERINSADINLLPIRSYDGPVSVVRDQAGLTKALKVLAAERVLGFDTETRPAFKKGERHAPALLQLAGASGVFVFQLNGAGFSRSSCARYLLIVNGSRQALRMVMTCARCKSWKHLSPQALLIWARLRSRQALKIMACAALQQQCWGCASQKKPACQTGPSRG